MSRRDLPAGAGGDGRRVILIAELRVRDAAKLRRYAAEVAPLMSAYGGRIVATSVRGEEVLEGDRPPALHVVHEWESREQFDAFWRSAEYEPLRALRHEACDAQIVVFHQG